MWNVVIVFLFVVRENLNVCNDSISSLNVGVCSQLQHVVLRLIYFEVLLCLLWI